MEISFDTVTDVALVENRQPRETSLAHNGILFLDELSELKHSVPEVIGQPARR